MLIDKLYPKFGVGILLLVLLIGENSFAQSYNIADEDGNSINTCAGTFTDSDAFNDEVYVNNEEFMVTLCAELDSISRYPAYSIDRTVPLCAMTHLALNGAVSTG